MEIENKKSSMNTNMESFEVTEQDFIYLQKNFSGVFFHQKKDGKILIKPINNEYNELLQKYKVSGN